MEDIIKIKETCLYINDLEVAKSFYGEKLELPIIHYAPGEHIFFRVGSSVLLCFNPESSKLKKSPPAHYGGGHQHFAFEVNTKKYDEAKKKIENMGIPIIDQVIWKNGQESFYFNDPEGNVLEIVPQEIWD